MFYKNPLILPRATSLVTVTDNGISTRGEEILHAGVPPARRGAARRLMFLPIRSGERSPYRSAAHNATERAISFLIPFYWSTREKLCVWECVCMRDTGAGAPGEGARASGGSYLHTAHRMCTLMQRRDRAVENDGVLFTRRVAGTRRPIESRPARATD